MGKIHEVECYKLIHPAFAVIFNSFKNAMLEFQSYVGCQKILEGG